MIHRKNPEPADGLGGIGAVFIPDEETRQAALRCVARNHRQDRDGAIKVAMALGIEDLLGPWVEPEDINRVWTEDRRAVS